MNLIQWGLHLCWIVTSQIQLNILTGKDIQDILLNIKIIVTKLYILYKTVFVKKLFKCVYVCVYVQYTYMYIRIIYIELLITSVCEYWNYERHFMMKLRYKNRVWTRRSNSRW